VLRGIFGAKRDEVTGEWSKLHNEELNDLYCSPTVVRVIKLRRMCGRSMLNIWGRGQTYTGFWWGNLRERDHWGNPGVDGRMILSWIFRKCGGMNWIDLALDRARWRACGNETSGSIKCGEFLD
jgi:hypothetical protein